ncbi:MAG: type II toxin-antitoxin system VapC family toxin [Anaerolineae bacterium]|nr:type II toxin-antitoxin system VapC family toxin [Anaerolineae bacterium]
MNHYFFDSSALVKRYVLETGTNWVRSITDLRAGNSILIAQITPAEIVSGVSRRKRAGQLSQRTAHAVRLIIDRHANREYMTIGMTKAIVYRAENLLEAHTLKAYDAVQLSSALESNLRLVTAGIAPLIFVSADQQLLNVAVTEGLPVDNPNQYP